MRHDENKQARRFEALTHHVARGTGTGIGLSLAVISLLIWILIGRAYAFSIEWENALTIYIGMATFLLIFIIQRGQNKALATLHLKLNELIVASNRADNSIIAAESLSEKQISDVQDAHRQIVSEEADRPTPSPTTSA